jgi:glycosyltransferase involved in cell wall biosynthesis
VKNLLAPLWHPPEPSFAGGFYRAERMLQSFRNYEAYVVASDTFPVDKVRVRRYPARFLHSNARLLFKVLRGLNWIWSTSSLVLLSLLWREKFDVIYAGPSEILPISLSAVIVAKIRRIPVILCNLNVQDTEFWSLNRLVHQAADAIITISPALADELRAEKIDVPIFIGTAGVDDFSVSPEPAQYDCIFVGRHTEAKGIFDLLRIWRLVCDARPGSRLACAGPINPKFSERIDDLLTSLQLEKSVTLFGPISEEKKWKLYAVSRLCVFPSHVEGWGIVPLEAHLAGIPVVAYDLPAYVQTIAESPGAFFVPCGDVTAFAQTVLERLARPSVDRTVLRAWAKKFTWSAAVEQEEQIINAVLQRVPVNNDRK